MVGVCGVAVLCAPSSVQPFLCPDSRALLAPGVAPWFSGLLSARAGSGSVCAGTGSVCGCAGARVPAALSAVGPLRPVCGVWRVSPRHGSLLCDGVCTCCVVVVALIVLVLLCFF